LSLKSLITETIVVDSMFDIESELLSIKESIIEQVITEGINDPGILKCVFMAGGPGSGKSFTAMDIFGIDKKLTSSFSSFGLKQVNSDSAFETLLKKNGIDAKELANIEKNDPELWYKIAGGSSATSDTSDISKDGRRSVKAKSIRAKAKSITKKQKTLYEAGRLGLIIDGTGHDYGKIAKNKKHAEGLGYDTYMIFVNTSIEVALERNANRDRVLPEELVKKSWKDVQQNLGKFQNLFGGNFRIVDNTVYKPISQPIQKAVNRFIKKPIYNRLGRQWMVVARWMKKNGGMK